MSAGGAAGDVGAGLEYARLPDRAVLALSGPDRVEFLQGLVSNDVAAVAPGCATWAALLTPQGKYLADFFIFADADRLLLDLEAAWAEDTAARLRRFRLRAAVEIAPAPHAVLAAWRGTGDGSRAAFPDWPPGAVAAADPRLPEAGWRALSPLPDDATAPDPGPGYAAWDRHRLRLGLPDGTRDLERERTTLLEAGFDELHGVSWGKGCYMGQELTARTKYRGLVKRRLVPVTGDGALPAPGAPILSGGAEVGTMRSGRDGAGLALLRIDATDLPLESGGAALRARRPDWMRIG